jgi:tripartite-type tricarboxylate transporter receptor subunit TctC
MIVPFPPGVGTPDVVGRRLAEWLAASLGRPVVVENRAGAGGTIGAAAIARAAPDGHLIGMGNIASHAVGPAVLRDVGFDPLRDVTYISMVAEAPIGLAVAAGSPHADLGSLLAAARAAPETIRIGSPGNGTAAHLSIERLASAAGVRFTHVPFRGAVASLPDLLAGRTEATMAGLGEIGGSDLRVLALGAPDRLAARPTVPTFREAGVDLVVTVWFGLCGPAGLPADIADRLHAETQAMLATPEAAAMLASLHSAPYRAASRADFAAFATAEAERWRAVARAANIRAE